MFAFNRFLCFFLLGEFNSAATSRLTPPQTLPAGLRSPAWLKSVTKRWRRHCGPTSSPFCAAWGSPRPPRHSLRTPQQVREMEKMNSCSLRDSLCMAAFSLRALIWKSWIEADCAHVQLFGCTQLEKFWKKTHFCHWYFSIITFSHFLITQSRFIVKITMLFMDRGVDKM